MTTMVAEAEDIESSFDVEKVREDFPSLTQEVFGNPLVYFDNAASAQKPQAMIDALARAYTYGYSNVHRGVHTLSQQSTDAYENARLSLQRFIGADRPEEVVFVRGTTEGINLVARAFVRPRLNAGDEILISHMEHHSNIVPWQIICEEANAKLRVVPITDEGELDMEAYASMLNEHTRIVATVHVSNALGTINPVREIVDLAHAKGIPVLLDGAQAAPHLPLDMVEMGVDFYTVSGHKLFGPTGIGILYGRYEHLESMDPYQGGGEMISSVTFEKTEYNVPPGKFEAGTPHIVGAIGLGAVADYLAGIGMDKIAAYEDDLGRYATERLAAVDGVRLFGTARHKAAVVSFNIDGVHAHDVGTILDREGVAVRVGHHCAQPVMDRFGVPSTARASLAFYNTREEVDRLVKAIDRVQEIFG